MKQNNLLQAILFDCDGTLVETERDGHRVAFNQAFHEMGLDVCWGIELYGNLLKISGGKERMRHYFDLEGWPPNADPDNLIRELHRCKTGHFMKLAQEGRLPLRPGISRLIDEAIAEDVDVAVCSTSNEEAVREVIESTLGRDRMQAFRGIFAGDIVAKKKPSPDIYQLAADKMSIQPGCTVVIEDTRIGLVAAKCAGMKCVITPSLYSKGENFLEANLVVENLDADAGVGLAVLQKLLKRFPDPA